MRFLVPPVVILLLLAAAPASARSDVSFSQRAENCQTVVLGVLLDLPAAVLGCDLRMTGSAHVVPEECGATGCAILVNGFASGSFQGSSTMELVYAIQVTGSPPETICAVAQPDSGGSCQGSLNPAIAVAAGACHGFTVYATLSTDGVARALVKQAYDLCRDGAGDPQFVAS